MDLHTICLSPRAISPLIRILAQETHVDVRKQIPTEKGIDGVSENLEDVKVKLNFYSHLTWGTT